VLHFAHPSEQHRRRCASSARRRASERSIRFQDQLRSRVRRRAVDSRPCGV
jgi:hypothetical protein